MNGPFTIDYFIPEVVNSKSLNSKYLQYETTTIFS